MALFSLMLRNFLLALLLCVSLPGWTQQLVVDNAGNYSNPNYLTQNILRGGSVAISNVSFSGISSQQIGYFTNGSSATGLSSGMILSTGKAMNAAGTNDSTNTSGGLGSSGSTDPDVMSLANGQAIFDALIYEFDVRPDGNELTLEYILASEEYTEYVCSQEADIFAIIISGPGITGTFSNNGKLISLIPTSSTIPVGINSINNGTPGTFGAPGGCSNSFFSPYYLNNTQNLFEYDGFTTVLQAKADVECNQLYHIRIVLADIGNNGFDTGLFLKERGLYSNSTGNFDEGAFLDSVIVEGCKPFYMVIYNPIGFTGGQTFQVNIGGTAINGTDYDFVPSTYTMNSGDSLLTIVFNPVADGVVEGFESVIVSYFYLNPCGDTVFVNKTFYIRDESPLVVTGLPQNTSICNGQSVLLNVNVSGGFPSYSISWNGMLQNNFNVTPIQDITYVAEVYDLAGCYWTGSFTVDHNPSPIVNAGPDITICSGQPEQLGLQIEGGPGATYNWMPASQLNSGNLPYPTMNPQTTQTFTVGVVTAAGCTGTDQLVVTVLPSPTVNAGPDQSITYLQTTTTLIGSGGGAPSWYPPDGLSCTNCFTPEASPYTTTTYTLYITSGNGCVSSQEVVVEVEIPMDVFVPTAFSPNNDGVNDLLIVRSYTIESMNLKIYDTWGQLLYENTHPDWGWDGTVNGVPANIGLYVYTLEVVFIQGKGTATFSGEFNLVR